jgi:transcriptional regulator with XRE-family HTH domain
MAHAGDRLRNLRIRRGLSIRKVADLSRVVAVDRNCNDFAISHARLAQVENDESVPSIFKLFSLSVIYGVPLNELLSVYVELGEIGRLHHSMNELRTHTVVVDHYHPNGKTVSLPTRFHPDAKPRETNLLSCMVEAWGEVPWSVLEKLRLRKFRYGWIGLSDYTMSPLIRPGSFVQIDESQKVHPAAQHRTEFDRPIYFIESRAGYLCSWCEVSKGRLTSIPHPLSPCSAQHFAFPSEADIIGRVTGIATRLVDVV